MTALQHEVLEAFKAVVRQLGPNAAIDGPRWSVEFREEFFAVAAEGTSVEGAVFPRDANFWDRKALDARFERLDFKSDEEMVSEIARALRSAIMEADGHV